ncbi:MAG TPA: response regulator [Candidatus Saccharimonadales bacterium]
MSNVLIIEDEKPLAAAYKAILEKHGYTVSVVYDGQDALRAVKSAMPDLILLDMRMPKMSGIEFLRELHKTDPGKHVIIFSNHDNQAEIDEAFKLGAKRYLLKSWAAPHDLVKVVEEALAG